MSSFSGRFVWYELMTTDPAAAEAFYGRVIGWGARDAGNPTMAYTLFTVGETHVAGLMAQPEPMRQMDAPPLWVGYVGVEDVDAAAVKATGLGARQFVPPTDIPEVGRFAVVADPQGARIVLFTPSRPAPTPPAAPGTPGHGAWHELHAADGPSAFAFYAAMFGWEKLQTMDMGPMGTYQIFGLDGQSFGGMFTKPPAEPVPYWLYYFMVPDIDAAVAEVGEAGGAVLNGPMQVPGGDWIIQGRDPQGGMFALVGKRA